MDEPRQRFGDNVPPRAVLTTDKVVLISGVIMYMNMVRIGRRREAVLFECPDWRTSTSLLIFQVIIMVRCCHCCHLGVFMSRSILICTNFTV